MAMNLQAQVPEKFNYQGIARDNTGAPLANQSLGIKISILHNTTVDYSESHTVTTNNFGLYSLIIGDGTPVFGGMALVDWNAGNKFIKVEIDPAGGINYTDLGTTELLSVPYALYAMESGGSGSGNPTGPAGGDLTGNYPNPSLANNAVTSNKIANGTVATADLANDAVTAAKIDPMGATSGQILKFDGTDWAPASDDPGAAGWELGGNAASATDFIGTTNAEPLRFKVNNTEAGFITVFGGSAAPNTAFGNQALYNLTTGGSNTAMGNQVLALNDTGSGNTAMGNASMYANTSGSSNSAFGRTTLRFNTTGKNNSAFGHDALNQNTTGDYNTANGSGALRANTTGSYNTATGHQALVLNTTGGGNTAMGRSAMLSNTTGTHNTALGYQADVGSGNLTNAIAIGAGALVGASNSLVLGSINGVNNATASTKVGIGTTTPSALLQVEGDTPTSGRFVQLAPTNIASAGDILALDAPSTASGYQFIEANDGTDNVFVVQDNGDIETMGLLKFENGSNDFSIRNTFNGFLDFYYNNSIVSFITSTGTYTTSDRRLKENIEPATSVLDRVNAINVVQYNYKKDKSKKETIGYIAQELDKQFPEFVELSGENEENAGYYGVNYVGMSAVAIKAIQEQQKLIEELQTSIKQLQAELEVLKK